MVDFGRPITLVLEVELGYLAKSVALVFSLDSSVLGARCRLLNVAEQDFEQNFEFLLSLGVNLVRQCEHNIIFKSSFFYLSNRCINSSNPS